MHCDYKKCNTDITKYISVHEVPVFLLKTHELTYFFCCPECRDKFMKSIGLDTTYGVPKYVKIDSIILK